MIDSFDSKIINVLIGQQCPLFRRISVSVLARGYESSLVFPEVSLSPLPSRCQRLNISKLEEKFVTPPADRRHKTNRWTENTSNNAKPTQSTTPTTPTMAFDQPLEADRVDDLNLFSSFVRAPIIGTIMWLLGGDAAKKQEEEQRRQDTAAAMIVEGANSDALSSISNKCTSKARLRRSSLKKAPHLIGSEVSELGELSDPLGNEAAATALPDLHLQRSTGSSSSSGSAVSLKRQRRKKQLSWSDETGHDLAMFLGVKEVSNRCVRNLKSLQLRLL